MSRRGLTFFVAAGFALVLVVLATQLPVPYVVFVPGPVTDTLHEVTVADGSGGAKQVPVVSVSGAKTYPVNGHLYLTTVGIIPGDCNDHPTLYEALKAWWDSDEAVEPHQVYCRPGQSSKQVQHEQASEMTGSQRDAVTAALLQLGYHPDTSRIVIASTDDGTPAAGRLRAGDALVSIGGTKVTSADQAAALVAKVPAGGAVPVTVDRAGTPHQVTVKRVETDNTAPHLAIGVTLDQRATFSTPHVSIGVDPDAVGGPSAGLAFTLGIIDRLTPGELTGGRTVAGTGTIDGFGNVGPIGGIQQKIAGAKRAGATVFLAPAGDCADAKEVAPSSMTLVRVETLKDALDALQAITSGSGSFPRC